MNHPPNQTPLITISLVCWQPSSWLNNLRGSKFSAHLAGAPSWLQTRLGIVAVSEAIHYRVLGIEIDKPQKMVVSPMVSWFSNHLRTDSTTKYCSIINAPLFSSSTSRFVRAHLQIAGKVATDSQLLQKALEILDFLPNATDLAFKRCACGVQVPDSKPVKGGLAACDGVLLRQIQAQAEKWDAKAGQV